MTATSSTVDYRLMAAQLHASLLNVLRVLDGNDGTHLIELDRHVCEQARAALLADALIRNPKSNQHRALQ